MPGSINDLAARMDQRKQRLLEDQQHFDRKQNVHAQNPNTTSELSELESSRQAPKPKRRHHRSSTKSPFDDDSSLQFSHNEKKSSTTTTSSSTPRQPNKFVKKSTTIPVTIEKISVSNSPRDISSSRLSTKQTSGKKSQPPPSSSTTGLLAQSTLLARAAHRQHLYAKGIELEPGAYDQANDDDDSSSDPTSTSGSKALFGSGKRSFLKKTATTTPNNQVPDLQHLDSETNSSDREGRKNKHKKNTRPASVLDTEDDSSLDIIGDGSSSEGRKTPTLTPRKGILKSPKDFIPKESEHSVQFSEKLVTVRTDEDRSPTPTKMTRITTPRRVQIAKKPFDDDDEMIPSETESVSTAIDAVENDDDVSSNEHISESPIDNVLANLVMYTEPLITSVIKKKPPAVTTKKPATSPIKFHHTQRTVSDISDEEDMKVEEIPEEISIINYSDDFSPGPTETSTPRSSTPTIVRVQKQPQTTRKVSTDDRQVQVDLMSAPFQSSLNQVHSVFFINQNELNEARPSSLIRSVVEPTVLQSLLTTNPVLIAVDDLVREQSSLLRSFIQLQRTYYESTIRSIRPEHIYVTKDNTLQFIADQQQTRIHFQSNDDSITN